MNQKEKIAIVDLLRNYVEQKGSQNKAAASLKGVSSAVVSHLLSGHWDPYSDDMFRRVGAQVGHNSNEWQFVETTNSKIMLSSIADAKANHLVLSFIGNAGAGKSATTKKIAAENKNIFRVECGQYWDRSFFLSEILMQLGSRDFTPKISSMMREIVRRLKDMENPQLILDEIDKVPDDVFLFLITLYNELFQHCSIIILGTHFLKKRIEDGIRLRKKGYEEIKSRYGSFIELEDTSASDIKLVCVGNGLSNEPKINKVSVTSKGDLRKVYNAVIAERIDEKEKLVA